MTQVLFRGDPVALSGDLPVVGQTLPAVQSLVGVDLNVHPVPGFADHWLVLNVFPSIDTGVCATSVKTFNERAASLDKLTVLCISNDLPFAMKRYASAEGVDNVVMLSAFRSSFGRDMGLVMQSGPLEGLLARSVFVVNPEGKIAHVELVPEIAQEPDYQAALNAVR